MFGTGELNDTLIRHKLRFIMAIIMIGFCVFVLRLGYLQIVCTGYYTEKSEDNRIRPVRLVPLRGVLYDRYGRGPLADNEMAFDICVTPNKAKFLQVPDKHRYEALQRLGLAPEAVLKELEANKGPEFEPVVIKRDVDKVTTAYLAEHNSYIQEMVIQARPKRRYKGLAVHTIGYTAPVNESDLGDEYKMNDLKGKAGVESVYEEYLRGKPGCKIVEVNAFGHTVRELPMGIKADPGQSINLTLDLELQSKAEALLEGKVGAIVAIDPRNGEVLVMVSKPDFDPNALQKDWKEIISDSSNPLLNRTIMGEYPPGSTFKIVTATAALEKGTVNTGTHFYCNGKFYLPNWSEPFRCHKATGHGSMNIHEALVESCNVFFYNVAHQKGVDVPLMHKYALMYGLGKKTGIDLFGEKQGFVPEIGKHRGDKINMCIGQGDLLVTPLQMANLICVMANRGFAYKPRIVSQPRSDKLEYAVDVRTQILPGTIDIIRKALNGVVKRGSSRQASLPDYETAGKTGSAENPRGDEHAWFIGFAPFDNPEIAVAVLVENAGRGSENAAPIAGQIFAQYFYKGQKRLAEGPGNSAISRNLR